MIMIIMIVLVMMMMITIKINEDEDKNEYYSCKILLEKKEITRWGVKSKKIQIRKTRLSHGNAFFMARKTFF